MSERFNTAAAGWDKGDIRQNIADAVFQTIVSRIALQPSMKIMDFGAGTGLLSFKIAPMVGSVVGVDLSEKMLEQLEAKNTEELSVEALYHDILSSSIGYEFNGIVSSMAIHHVEDTAHLFREFYAHLKKDGFIAIADLEEEDGSFHTHGNEGVHHFGFNRDTLRKTLEEIGFQNVRFHEAYQVVRENGTYPIFVVTAIK
ncbi:MAG: class I SAM-dependent methyltransferase [Sulfurimonas sp.]|jgi:2-polyprenyl-3-methyl-5-hydroxy-6-metoxy-1,4-benzoquinol methylase